MATRCHRSFNSADDPLAKLVGQVVRDMDARAPDGSRDSDRAQHTHAFMDGSNPSKVAAGYNRGWLRLPDTHHDEFLEKMGQSIDCNFTPCVSERATLVRRAFADFDEETATSKDVEWQLTVARLWQQALKTCWPDAAPHVFTVCVLLRKEVAKESTVNGRVVRKWKNGMHLVAPNLYVTESQLSSVRDVALRLLHDTDMLLEQGDGTWEKILDPKFDTLRMMGNCKAVKCTTCRNRVRMRKTCVECSGEGLFVDSNAVYELDHILGAAGDIDENLETLVARKTTAQKLKLTCIRTVTMAEPLAGFTCPTFVDARKREMAMRGVAAGDGDGDGKGAEEAEEAAGGKTKEVLEQSDPHFNLIQEFVQEVHPEYRHIRVREIKVVRTQSNKRVTYIVTPWEADGFPCLNLVECKPHRSEGIYFEIPRKSGQVFQRCGCKCRKGVEDGRLLGQCSAVRSPGQQNVVLPVAARLEMFDYPLFERRALLNQAEEEALTQRTDPWVTGGEDLLVRMCMSAMGTPPIVNSVEGEQQRNALTAFLRRAAGRKVPNIRERKADMERAKAKEAEVQSRIMGLVCKMRNSDPRSDVMQRVLQSSLFQEVDVLQDMRNVQQGTHQFRQSIAHQSVGADGYMAFTKVDEGTGTVTFYPDRDTIETMRLRGLRDRGDHARANSPRRGRTGSWDGMYADFEATFGGAGAGDSDSDS